MELSRDERNRGIYIIGKTGSGKSTLQKMWIARDILENRGLIFLDAHGVDCLDVLNAIPSHRTEDVCYFDLSDYHYMVGFKPIIEPHHLVTALTGIFGPSLTERAKYFLFHGLQLIKDNKTTTLIDLPRVYHDEAFRQALLSNTTNDATYSFWTEEHKSFSKRYNEEAPGTIYNKVGQFLASPPIRAALSQQNPKFDLETALRFNQIVVINIAKGRIGKEAASLMGSLFLSHLHSILFQGAIAECNLYVDEFQSFGTDLISDMLSEDRKFGLNACFANQFFSQLRETNRDAILGNIGTLVAFRIGSKDAELLAPEFNSDSQQNYVYELKHQPAFQAYVKRSTGKPELLHVAPLPTHHGSLDKVIQASRRRFARKYKS